MKAETRACLGIGLGTRVCLSRVVVGFIDVSLIGAPLLVGPCLGWGAGMGLINIDIEKHAIEGDLSCEALLKVVFASSKARERSGLGALDLARCLSLIHLLHFRFLTIFLVSSLSVLGVGLIVFSRPCNGSIKFANENSAKWIVAYSKDHFKDPPCLKGPLLFNNSDEKLIEIDGNLGCHSSCTKKAQNTTQTEDRKNTKY